MTIVRAVMLALAALLAMPAPLAAAPRAVTAGGILEGVSDGGVEIFRGIPYAAPPVGADRWRAPQPFPAWRGVRSAARFGHSCWQAVSPAGFGPWTHEFVVADDISEDCLFLNVWKPAATPGPRPVLAWIHGGGFNSGSGAIPIYDGRALAARGIVVVTINYRVGVFGFLEHPELTAEAGGTPVGNFGLQDVVAALRWVQANIAAFGGDPRQVTVAGQSAGAMAVQDLVASPLAKGLFQRAIAESGLPRPLPSLADAEQQGVAFAREKGAASLAALRAMPAEALQPSRGSNAIRFVPVADGILLPDRRWRAVNDVPMLVGFNADEGSALGQDYGSPDAARLQALLRTDFGPAADALAPLYPARTPADRAAANRQVHRDRDMGALVAWARRRAETARSPAYAYLFAHVMPGPEAGRWGAFHSSEVPYVFQTLDAAPERPFTAADRRLSDRLACRWIGFVRSGRPDCGMRPKWPALTPAAPVVLRVDGETAAVPLLPKAKLDLIRRPGGPLDAF